MLLIQRLISASVSSSPIDSSVKNPHHRKTPLTYQGDRIPIDRPVLHSVKTRRMRVKGDAKPQWKPIQPGFCCDGSCLNLYRQGQGSYERVSLKTRMSTTQRERWIKASMAILSLLRGFCERGQIFRFQALECLLSIDGPFLPPLDL